MKMISSWNSTNSITVWTNWRNLYSRSVIMNWDPLSRSRRQLNCKKIHLCGFEIQNPKYLMALLEVGMLLWTWTMDMMDEICVYVCCIVWLLKLWDSKRILQYYSKEHTHQFNGKLYTKTDNEHWDLNKCRALSVNQSSFSIPFVLFVCCLFEKSNIQIIIKWNAWIMNTDLFMWRVNLNDNFVHFVLEPLSSSLTLVEKCVTAC